MATRMPLSGDVAVTQWLQATGLGELSNYWSQQTGLININNMDSADTRAEQEIVERVASYGRQLGWILSAVDLLIHKLEKTDLLGKLTHEEEDILEQVKTLKHRVDAAKHRAQL